MVLYKLAEDCNYGEMKDEMIRDRLVVGIRDSNLSERLQLDSDLTLDKAKKAIRQREAVKEQQKELASAEPKIGAIQCGSRTQKKPLGKTSQNRFVKPTQNRRQHSSTIAERKCQRCGKGYHKKELCPAKDAKCHRCGKVGHYKTYCYTKTVAEISRETANEEEDVDLDSVFLNAIGKSIPFTTVENRSNHKRGKRTI